ncbi:MAG: hypothetical protein QOC62_3247 [Mycobacterium sp.]|nr:hypothetical protein [Mycobacterium sp.]
MAVNASVSKQCPGGQVILVPGRLGVKKDGAFFTPKTDEVFVDIMPTSVESVTFKNPTVKLRAVSPTSAEFQIPNINQPNKMHYSYPVPSDKTRIQCVFEVDEATINRGNSLSFRFPITGRNEQELELEVSVSGQPTKVVADSCLWTVGKLSTDTTNLGKPLDEVPVGAPHVAIS